MKELINKIIDFETQLDSNQSLQKEKFVIDKQAPEQAQISIQRELGRIESTVLEFYENVNGIEVRWIPSDQDFTNNEIVGRIKINSFSQVIRDWGGVVFFDSEVIDSPVRKFFPLDFFTDEAAVGFCTKEGWRNMLYLYQFEGELMPLYVNFKSYLQLMLYTRGCFYWQYLIKEIVDEEENEVSVRIKKFLPTLFPDFSFSQFEKLFKELRIK